MMVAVPLMGVVVSRPEPDMTQSTRFASTRAAHRDETAEDYVEAIAQLIERTGSARVGELARCMGVSHVTVTRIVDRLCKEGLAEREPRGPIELTELGRAMAEASRIRHEIVLGFLLAAGVDDEQAQIDAEGMEHHASGQTLGILAELTRRLKERD